MGDHDSGIEDGGSYEEGSGRDTGTIETAVAETQKRLRTTEKIISEGQGNMEDNMISIPSETRGKYNSHIRDAI